MGSRSDPIASEFRVSDMTRDDAPGPEFVPDKVRLFDGDLLLYRRQAYASGFWNYRLLLPDSSYERRSTGERRLEDAQRVASARYHEVRWRQDRGYSVKPVTFAQAATEFVAHLRHQHELKGKPLSPTAMKMATIIDRHLLRYFGERNLSEITARDAQRYYEWYVECWRKNLGQTIVVHRRRSNRRAEYERPISVRMPGTFLRKPSANSQAMHESTIRRIFAHAVELGYIAAHEQPTFRPIKREMRRRGAFSEDELQRLLAHLEARIAETIYPHHRAGRRLLWLFVRFVVLTGLRPGVESDLRFQDIELRSGAADHCAVRVRRGKTASRTVIAPAELWQVVQEIMRGHPNALPSARIWMKPDGTVTDRFGAQFLQVLRELGLERDLDGNARTLYSLRHTYATRRLNAHTAIDKLALNMGTSVQMIQAHYGHVLVEDHAAELASRPPAEIASELN